MNEALDPMKAFWLPLVALAPKALLVLLVLVLGLLFAFVARRLVRWLTEKSGAAGLAEKAGVAKLLYAVGFKRGLAHFLGGVAYWAVLLLTFSAVADLLGLPGVASFTAMVMAFLPRLVSAGLVLLAGFWFATVVQSLVLKMGRARPELKGPGIIAKVAHYAVLALTVTLAADQAGIETELVNILMAIVLGAGLFAVALAFGLGARTMFECIIARHHYEGLVHPGDRIRVGDDEGEVVRYSSVAVVLKTAGGEKLIPCRELMKMTVEMTSPESSETAQPAAD